MIIIRLWRLLSGYLHIQVEGIMLEKFINLATEYGIQFWDIRKTDHQLRVQLGIAGFRLLRPIARKTRCRVRIRRKLGLPFYLYKLGRRKALVAGAFLFFAFLYWLSSYVWFVEVRGTEAIQAGQVLQAAAAAGLKPGVLKPALDTKRVERELLRQLDTLAWVSIYFTGTRAVVEVIEKTIPPSRGNGDIPADGDSSIVAVKNGVISKLLVFKGEAAVSEGQAVREGQILIKAPTGGSVPAHARGVVLARVWYEVYLEQPLIEVTTWRTGHKYERHAIRLYSKEIIITGRQDIPFSDYEVELKKIWRNTNFPVEVITTTYYEIRNQRKELEVEEAVEEARRKAMEAFVNQVPSDAKVIGVTTEVVQVGEGFVGVRLRAETEENIGSYRKSQ